MKICTKCKKEYTDDMAFCPYCGISLQPKIEERVCPACGKAVLADNVRFCPYCGHSFTSPETNTPNSTKIPLPPSVNIKKNYVKMQPLNQEKKPDTTPLESDVPRSICPSCKSVIYAKNLNTCPYCGEKLGSSKTADPDTLAIHTKSKDNKDDQTVQGIVCPGCHLTIHTKNLQKCPYCGKSLNGGSSNNNNHTSGSVTKALPPDVNIKKNYVKMQPLAHADNSSNTNSIPAAQREQSTNNESNNSFFSPKGRRGRLNYFFVNTILVIIYVAAFVGLASVFRAKETTMVAILVLLYIAFFYLLFCNEAKRFHDLDKSTSWAVAFLLVPGLIYSVNPMLGLIAAVISCLYPLFAKGTSGPNQYGDEP